jgi:pimeloyl-ACP methyl ester carboxylesterase
MARRDGSALRVHGVALEARWTGPEAELRPTLVFLHGGLACAATWHDFPDALAAATGCGALVYSRRGHGRSGAAPARWPVTFMHGEARRWLPAVLRASGVTRPILVGHSDGASIAILYAAARRGPPPLGLVLLAPHVFVEDRTLASIAALREEPERRAMLERLARRHGHKAARLFESWAGVWLRAGFRRFDLSREVSRVTRPMLVVQGDADEFGTLAQVDVLRSNARAAVRCRVLRGCGHVPHRDRTRETLAAAARFVRDLVHPGSAPTNARRRQ